jgi:phage-related tail fiber protein
MSYPTNPATGDTYVLGTKSWTYDGTNWVNQATFATFGGAGGAVPAGTVIYHAANTPPTDFIKANGAAISRTTYSDLFTAIGTTFGVGDGSTTFNVPDLRGEFPRGWDDSRGIDSGRAFGSAQTDAMQGHRHNTTLDGNYFKNDGILGPGSNGWSDQPSGGQTKTGNPTTDGSNGTPRTAAETRPRNIALLACIKY